MADKAFILYYRELICASLADSTFSTGLTGTYNFGDAWNNRPSPSSVSKMSISVSASYDQNGITYSVSGSYFEVVVSGVDKIVKIYRTKNYSTNIWVAYSRYGGGTITFNNNPQTEAQFNSLKACLLQWTTSNTAFPKYNTKYNSFTLPSKMLSGRTYVGTSTIRKEDTFTITSSNPKIATVSMDSNNQPVVNCLKGGTVTITITSDSDSTITASNTIAVVGPSVTGNISSFRDLAIEDKDTYIALKVGSETYAFKKYEGEAPITDLTGTKWRINDTTCPAGYGQFNVNFNIEIANGSDTLLIGYRFNFDNGATPQANIIKALPVNWNINAGDEISFIGGTDITNASLIAWLQEHATQILVNLISFTISGTTYQAEEGMTWNDWVNSEYNTSEDELVVEQNGSGAVRNVSTDGYVSTFPSTGVKISTPVSGSDEIIESTSYGYPVISGGGSCN